MSQMKHDWWASLRHGGMLLDTQRLSELITELPDRLPQYQQDKLRHELDSFQENPKAERSGFVRYVLHRICGFTMEQGEWSGGGNVEASWTRRALTGDAIRPQHLWVDSETHAVLPVFIDEEKRLGIGKGRRSYSRVLRWLRQGDEQLAILTNGYQWRIVFAGLDYDAFAEWDIDLWFSEGQPSLELAGLVSLVSPKLWVPPETGKSCALVAAVNDSRKGQAELSQVLGERVRRAAEELIQAHQTVLNENYKDIKAADIYRAAVRMIMRLVVILFAESREGLLPTDNPVYHSAYSIQELRDTLRNASQYRLVRSFSAWPRLLALMNVIYRGSYHEALPVPNYGGDLFRPGVADSPDGVLRVLHIFETGCFKQEAVNDHKVKEILRLLTLTEVRIRQGRSSTRVTVPVDFGSLSSEYIGILYEGLLDFELRRVGKDEPVVFLNVGNQPALPLSTLEAMDDKAIKNLLEKMKDTSSGDDDDQAEAEEVDGEDAAGDGEEEAVEEQDESAAYSEDADEDPNEADERLTLRQRAEAWARHACEVAGLVKKPRGKKQDQLARYNDELARAASNLITHVVLPGEWYLVRWGGTRKGSGTFYTRPQLATPTVHRTLRPLANDAPTGEDGQPDTLAPAEQWTPKPPEEILQLKVCDPACGSGSFLLAALRFLTDALYESLIFHNRIEDYPDHSILQLIEGVGGQAEGASEMVPCRPDDDTFEDRTKARLRRYIVERCIYGVDLDPLAVELCRLSLWIETLDRHLPLTFLNHKVKCGNSLVGAWFDQFAHYPLMAWEREGGDSSHTNGVHFNKGEFTKQIKELKKQAKDEIIKLLDDRLNLSGVDFAKAQASHHNALNALAQIHSYGIVEIDKRRQRYEQLLADEGFIRLKEAFDLWCALWFWPLDKLELAPLPEQFAKLELGDDAWQAVREVAAQRHFFHWELEFPDVFNAGSAGFDAILGNPPWDISKPNSKEFFSSHDPLYRSYGKQEAIAEQKQMFERDLAVEDQWLDYSAYFKGMSNWVKFAGFPFGDRVTETSACKPSFDFSLGTGGKYSHQNSMERHELWRGKRATSIGFADANHAFGHQGGGDINLYKTFLEQAHALLRPEGRMGFIVPSGVYSDFGTIDLRKLFIERCRWEWLFGFENREKIFDIDSRFKFNPVIIQKGGETQAIRTAFMRRELSDWEDGEDFVTDYPRAQVEQFSPNSLAILEIQSARDLEILTKIYSNSVLLGDQGPDGWGIQYAREFDMTNDSKLFPPRTKWEEWGYQPDEYSRWINGPWRPIAELWQELGIGGAGFQPADNAGGQDAHPTLEVQPIDADCQRAIEEGLRSGEVGRTEWQVRCAQPPYDRLPIPRADIPEGIILSRNADLFIHEDDIPTVTFAEANGKPLKIKSGRGKEKVEYEVRGKAIALPLYEGRMIGQFDFSEKGWVKGKGRSAEWREIPWEQKKIEPQYLMGASAGSEGMLSGLKMPVMNIGSATNSRSIYATLISDAPCNHSLNAIQVRDQSMLTLLCAVFDSAVFDSLVRKRLTGINISFFVLDETAIFTHDNMAPFDSLAASVAMPNFRYAPFWLNSSDLLSKHQLPRIWSVACTERTRRRCQLEAIIAACYGLDLRDVLEIINEVDYPRSKMSSEDLTKSLNPKGFWRVDKDKHPEHRLTVLSLVTFHDLLQHVESCGGDREAGIASFMAQNDGEGWLLPETLRLADYGLGHDDRAKEHQPVRSCFGPRFYDWQLAQTAEESWRECHLHARNLLGAEGYQKLLDELEGDSEERPAVQPTQDRPATLFDNDTEGDDT